VKRRSVLLLPELRVVSGVVCFEVFSVSKGKDPTASVKEKDTAHSYICACGRETYLVGVKSNASPGLTLMESSCCLRASSASLLGENIRLCREQLGGSVVGTANMPHSASPLAADPSRERGRLRPP